MSTPVVLVAEDEPALLAGYSMLLGKLGFRTLLASDGIEAFEQFCRSEKEISLILTDGKMPRQGGIWLARQIRYRGSNVPVILVSGGGGTNLPPDCEALFYRKLQKPASARDLTEVLNQLFPR